MCVVSMVVWCAGVYAYAYAYAYVSMLVCGVALCVCLVSCAYGLCLSP